MPKRQFRILYREFLFRVIDLELLSPQGDVLKLLGQFAALLVSIRLALTLTVGFVGAALEPELSLLLSWGEELFLISISMLAVGLFAVLSWDTAFPDKRDVMVLAHLPVRAPPVDLDALSGAGAIRSTAADLLTYLQTQLHPESLGSSLGILSTALVQSHELHADVSPESRIALAWMYNPTLGAYWHNGSAAGYTSDTFFNPKEDYAAVVLYNSASPVGFASTLDEHIRERFAGLPAERAAR